MSEVLLLSERALIDRISLHNNEGHYVSIKIFILFSLNLLFQLIFEIMMEMYGERRGQLILVISNLCQECKNMTVQDVLISNELPDIFSLIWGAWEIIKKHRKI